MASGLLYSNFLGASDAFQMAHYKLTIIIFLSEKLILSDRMNILSIPSRKLSESSTVINLLLNLRPNHLVMKWTLIKHTHTYNLQIMPVSVTFIRSWMLNFVSSRIITDFVKSP